MQDNRINSQIGVISDTHGHLPAKTAHIFKHVDLIVHAGDIDQPDVLASLKSIAPVVAVRGNMDRGTWARELAKTEIVTFDNIRLYVIHDINELDMDPAVAGFSAVISGHSHQPLVEEQAGVLFLNPGSASMPRHDFNASVALLHIRGAELEVELVCL